MTEQRSSRRLSKSSTATPMDTASQVFCFLCKGQHQNLSSPMQWKREAAREYVLSYNMPKEGVVCQACRKDVTRALSDSIFVPRWSKTCTKIECCIKDCKNDVFASLHKTTIEHMNEVLHSLDLESSLSTIPVPLCKHHYHVVYNTLHPTQTHCVTCGVSLRHSSPKPCPQPSATEDYLKHNTGFQGSIGENDLVCYSCYRSHLFVLRQSKTISTDRDLKELIHTIDEKKHTIQSVSDLIEASTDKVISAVGHEFLEGNALLLPHVYDWFCHFADEQSHHLKEVDTSKLSTSANVLSNLIATLQHHLTYCCKTKKYGTLLYRSHTDLTLNLARALWKVRQQEKSSTLASSDVYSTPNPEPNDSLKVLNDLNSLACSHINHFLSKHRKDEFELSDFNIDQQIENIDPKLWEAIQLLTRSMSERKGVKTSSLSKHTKKIRRFFIFCAMMFCINEDYTIPLHTLVTDVIDGQGGSAMLIKVLNRLGACASADTLSRYIQHKSSNRTDTIHRYLSTDSFTVVSADNIDFLHSYARVSKGSKSSTHATSIQAVQPLPSLAELLDVSNWTGENSELGLITMGTPGSKRTRDRQPSCLPPIKKKRMPRTGTEQSIAQNSDQHQVITIPYASASAHTSKVKHLSDFFPNQQEKMALAELKEEMNVYMLQKVAIATQFSDKSLLNIQDYFSCTRATHTEKSNVYYLNIMDAVADNKDTLMSMLFDLHMQFIESKRCEYLVVEGDAKLYEILQSLKIEYGSELKWVVPYPGDWHTLMNFQKALMKPYFDAGLKSLAEACGYPEAAIKYCSQFKKTHHFITEAWEALYRTMLIKFIESGDSEINTSFLNDVIQSLESTKGETENEFNSNFNAVLSDIMSKIPLFNQQFDAFIHKMSNLDDVWKFWSQFVFEDAMAYVSLFLAIRSGDWHLRIGSVKQMAPLFTAFDHPTYQKLISNHIADLLDLPDSIMLMLSQGAFVLNITGREWHSVAIDEGHEMLINKQCKNAIVKPSEDYMNRMATHLTYRTRTLQGFKEQLFPQSFRLTATVQSAFSSKPRDTKFEINVQSQMNALSRVSFLAATEVNRGLINYFSGTEATNQQHYDLLHFRRIGEEEYKLRVSFFMLKEPSVKAPNRRKALQTFSIKHVKTKRVSQLERDKKLLVSAMKKKILFSQKNGEPVDSPEEQLLEYPLSISDNVGNPLKGQKSYFTTALQKRYKNAEPPIITPYLQPDWTPQCSILEGMFLINSLPLPNHFNLANYGTFLLKRFIISQFKKGSSEVHVIFDSPGRLENTPKYFEQKRRDSKATVATDHVCAELTSCTVIPRKKWRENYLNCRRCKRNLVIFLGDHFLKNASIYLSIHQKLYVAGAFEGDIFDTAWFVTRENNIQPDPVFLSNAEETDTRLWLHVRQTRHTKILIHSPDTDVYIIGMPLECAQSKEVIVQVSKHNAREARLLSLSSLTTALENDPDLGRLSSRDLPQLLQAIYVSTGCDYISFFSQIGKASFLKYFLQYASFIIDGANPLTPGSLVNISLANSDWKLGLLSFLRLIGTVYLKKHSSAFDVQSPVAHYNQFRNPSLSVLEQHHQWLDNIRQTIWYRTKFDNEMLASNQALAFHWKRSCWVMHMWKQADHNPMILEPITQYGWTTKDGQLAIQWDTDDNIKAIRERVTTLTKGCKCLSGCSTKRCGCVKKQQLCSAGCECTHCTNTPSSTSLAMATVTENVIPSNDLDDLDDDLDDIDDIMTDVFGGGEDRNGADLHQESDKDASDDDQQIEESDYGDSDCD